MLQPHVTLAWSNDTEAVAAAVAALKLDIDFPADTLAMGSVGDHGTVLKGKDLVRSLVWHLKFLPAVATNFVPWYRYALFISVFARAG